MEARSLDRDQALPGHARHLGRKSFVVVRSHLVAGVGPGEMMPSAAPIVIDRPKSTAGHHAAATYLEGVIGAIEAGEGPVCLAIKSFALGLGVGIVDPKLALETIAALGLTPEEQVLIQAAIGRALRHLRRPQQLRGPEDDRGAAGMPPLGH